MYRLPAHDQRTAIVGSTGSGKTHLAVWLLSTRDFVSRPWTIIDYKRDNLLSELPLQEIDVRGSPATKPGLYTVRPIRGRDDEALKDFLWKIWMNEDHGVYTDEGYMLGQRNDALSALLTQGRSKNIEMITLIQRPVWCDKFIFSEASHFYVMKLTIEDDRKYISGYLNGTPINHIAKHYSFWYDAGEQEGLHLRPVPPLKTILQTFDNRLSKRKHKMKAI